MRILTCLLVLGLFASTGTLEAQDTTATRRTILSDSLVMKADTFRVRAEFPLGKAVITRDIRSAIERYAPTLRATLAANPHARVKVVGRTDATKWIPCGTTAGRMRTACDDSLDLVLAQYRAGTVGYFLADTKTGLGFDPDRIDATEYITASTTRSVDIIVEYVPRAFVSIELPKAAQPQQATAARDSLDSLKNRVKGLEARLAQLEMRTAPLVTNPWPARPEPREDHGFFARPRLAVGVKYQNEPVRMPGISATVLLGDWGQSEIEAAIFRSPSTTTSLVPRIGESKLVNWGYSLDISHYLATIGDENKLSLSLGPTAGFYSDEVLADKADAYTERNRGIDLGLGLRVNLDDRLFLRVRPSYSWNTHTALFPTDSTLQNTAVRKNGWRFQIGASYVLPFFGNSNKHDRPRN